MLKRHNFTLGLVWLVVLFLVPLPLIQTLSAGLPSVYSSEAQAIYLGAIAYSWMLSAIYLATKPKWLDRLIGLPDIFMIHGIVTILALGLAYLHKFGTVSDGLVKLLGEWALYLFTGLMVYSLIFMAGWLTSRIPFLLKIKRTLEKVLKHEVSVWIHRINIIATALVFIHVNLISYVTAIRPFMVCFYLYTGFVVITYIYSKVKHQVGYLRGTVQDRQLIAKNVQELTIIPKNHPNLDLRVGDFVFIAFPHVNGLREYHPFSIVNMPTSPAKITLAIRGDGDFTRGLADVQTGDLVKLDGGFGHYQTFLEDHHEATEIVIIAGGIGVTPLLSVVEANANRQIVMFYSAHDQQGLIYLERLKQWSQRPTFHLNYQVGRYQNQTVMQQLSADRHHNIIFLISGPAPMIRYWKKTLKKDGIGSGQMYAEEFNW